ncbi:hypothetical protein FG386_003166 [Cryptosporidium ryanae]|uniref:uncharacterized protein n=1 Tax=Cryptosporidium ryanae TaxID=515981 RepID=UPI00351A64A7|nr:hypothetical protein FG386_003166 [Cryptosporidium ryanae]
MDVIFVRIALEELSFSGGNGYFPKELIDKVRLRITDNFNKHDLQLKNTNIRKTIINGVIKHPNVTATDVRNGKVCSTEYALSKSPEFNGIRLYSNECLQRHVLNLNIYSNISEVEGRLAVYMAIAGKGFEGCWQYEISRMLNMDPKMVFQHLKSLYKHDVIVRFSIPMPVNYKKKIFSSEDSSQMSGGHISAIIWLTRFFDFNRIPRELSQLIWCQHVQPLSAEIVRILEHKAPGKIAWEKDIRTLCTGFLILHDENSADHLICSQRTANKVFNKVRDTLLTRNVIRVFAWNPATKSYSPCLCLKDAFPISNIEYSKNQLTIKTEVEVPNINELSSSNEIVQNNFTPFNDFEKFSNEGVFSDLVIEENSYFNVKNISELTEVDQVLWLIRASNKVGMVSLEFVRLIGINIKRLGKLLTDLCKIGIIYKVPQRYNRTFMYRYYYCSSKSRMEDDNTLICQKNNGISCNNETSLGSTSIISKIFNEAFPNKNNDLSNFTEQFVRRLVLAKNWIEEHGILTIPEFTKLFSEAENTLKGPDRKTIRRVLLKLKEIEDTIKETFISSDKNTINPQSGDITVFFSSKRFTEEEARDLKALELKNKRSMSTKHAIEKRKRELSHVAAIVDASTAVIPKPNDNGSKDIILNELDSTLINNSNSKFNDLPEPKLISSENGDESVVVNTNFLVASLNIEIDNSNLNNCSNSKKVVGISNLNIPGTFSNLTSSEKFVPSKRINLGFSSLARGTIKFGSNIKEMNFINFNQKILAHYGFIFPLMIRLKVLHCHIISLVHGDKEPYLFSTKEILEEMTIDIFLRVIGFGYRSSFIEEYLMFGSSDSFMFDSNTKLKEIPQNIYEKLTKTHLKKNISEYDQAENTRNTVESRTRKATHILFKMLNLLAKLNLLSCENEKDQGNSVEDVESNSKGSVIDTISISNSKWKVHINAKIPLIVNSSEFSHEELIKYIKHEEKVFNLKENSELENYWMMLYNESLKTQKLIIELNLKEYSLLLPEMILKRHWKTNLLLPLEKRNYLEGYARRLVIGKNESETGNDNTPVVLSLASPEIKRISNELSIAPLTTLRYLLRVVDSISVGQNSFDEKENLRKVIFHPIRDPKYQCHICHALYSTHPAIISHYKVIHNISTINTSMYTIQRPQTISSKNTNLNLNSSLKVQIINENYIPISLRHLIEDTNQEYEHKIGKNMRTDLLRAFLRLSKEDISLLYFILFISEKIGSKYSNINKINNLKKLFLLCNDKKNQENNIYTLQFSRIKSLILDNIGTNNLILESAIRFVFSCLKTIYPLNSKLIETLKMKEGQRICWSSNLKISSFSIRWRNFLSSQSNTDIEMKNSLINETNPNFYKTESIVETVDFSSSMNTFSDTGNFLMINRIKSGLLTPKYIYDLDNIDNFYFGMSEDVVNSYLEHCVKRNILKQLNKQNEFKTEAKNYSLKNYAFSRNMLINCFGKSVLWREIFDLCYADLEISSSTSKRVPVKDKIDGPYALNHLNNLLDENCTFEIEWDDEDFYVKATNKTNEDLLRLLNEITETNSKNGDIDILEEFNYEINQRENDGLGFVEDQHDLGKIRKLSKVDEEIEIISNTHETQKKGKTNPLISKIVVNYTGKDSLSDNNIKEFLNTTNIPKVPFIGTVDSDPIEINKVPYYFSITGILNNYSELEIKELKRNKTFDPIIEIMKQIFDILNDGSETTKIVLNVISMIIIKMKDEKRFFSIRDIEDFILLLDNKSIETFRRISCKIEDPGVAIYKFEIPFTYHLMFFLEFTRICTRVPIGDYWMYTTYDLESDFLCFNESTSEYNSNIDSTDLKIPINIPTRIWLLWSSNSLTTIFSESEVKKVYEVINKRINKLKNLKDESLYLHIDTKFKPFNGFISLNGEINRPICGILIYHICQSIYKSPVINISDFTDKFSIFSPCEIKFMIESLLGEKCMFTYNTDIILSRPIYSILRIFEQ